MKSTKESNADVGDRANDSVRINGSEVRARVVGEGGNLGFTQLGRIEYALGGGRINTDFIDNSAGVDTSRPRGQPGRSCSDSRCSAAS